jgi:putative transcriptional regulator
MENRLANIINERGLKRGFVAKKAGISRTTLYLIERGEQTPSVDIAMKLARAVGVEIQDIFFHKAV